jgi:ankyrin repeat protein
MPSIFGPFFQRRLTMGDPNEFLSRVLYQLPSPNQRLLSMIKRYPDELMIQNPHDLYSGFYPLHMALRYRAGGDIVRAILKAKPEAATLRDGSGSLPLHVALEHSSTTIVEIVLKAFPEGSQLTDGVGSLVLHRACCYDKATRLLLRSYPEGVRAKDAFDRLPLHNAIMCNASSTTVQDLVTVFPDGLLQQDLDGDTPLHKASAGVGHPSCHHDITSLVCVRPNATKVKNAAGELALHKCVCSIVAGGNRKSKKQGTSAWEGHFWALVAAYPDSLIYYDNQERSVHTSARPLEQLAFHDGQSRAFWERAFEECPLALISKLSVFHDVPLSKCFERYKYANGVDRTEESLVSLLQDDNSSEGALLRYTYDALLQHQRDNLPVEVSWFHMLAYCSRLLNSSLEASLQVLEKDKRDKLYLTTDSNGNTPLHAMCMGRYAITSQGGMRYEPVYESRPSPVGVFLWFQSNSGLLEKRNNAGELPLHVLLKFQDSRRKLADVISLTTTKDESETFAARDTPTLLYPFMLAAMGDQACLETTFYLLQKFVSVRSLEEDVGILRQL